ncbi:tumor necrosis factor ligand superfamily member 15 isoform X1 [Ursus maritimus]|uniref:Tumor necrosis factor ligand superfamily member 15 n=1 Tax=Ursus maritimus TaxID=29073 RepID=A0A8M1G685_URSMA|nr:tumor necrosis factor ligand superfamily member 15 isoform X1 [Ursus maritimus]
MLGMDVPIFEMRKQSLGQAGNLPKVTGQDTFVFKTLSPSLSLEKGQQSTVDQAEGEESFSPVAGTTQLQKYCLPSSHPLTHTEHLSLYLTDASSGAGGDKPRAHLTVVRQSPTQPLKHQFPALHWEHELGLAFTKNRMNYTNKFLVIPESGDYFVYSQVTFRGTTSECGEIRQGNRPNKPDSIIVVITKVTDSYPEPTQLLMGTKSVCEIGSNWFQPIYLGAMFSLQEGDKLMVNVSDISLVDYTKEDKTFFGAFLL